MVRALEQTIAQIVRRPDADREQVNSKRLAHIEKLKALRAELDEGFLSLDQGGGQALNMEEFLRDKNAQHGGT